MGLLPLMGVLLVMDDFLTWVMMFTWVILVVKENMPHVYQARTTLMIGRVIEDPNPNQGEINLAQSLAQAYADIAKREPVRNATMEALGLTWFPNTWHAPFPRHN